MQASRLGSHVCILGCGRSGTSIFGELFQALPGYRYYSEPLLSQVSSIDFSTPVALKVPRPGPNDPTTAGLPFLLSEFLSIVPENIKFFWQVRHPLDTICSLQVGIKNNWGHHPRPPDYLNWLERPLIEQCAYHWNYLNTSGYQQIRHLATVNRFEDMIGNPRQNAHWVVEQIGLSPNEGTGEIEQWANSVQDENNPQFIEAQCSRPYSRDDHSKKVGRWKENLTSQQVKQVLPIVMEGAEIFGYAVGNT